MNDLKERINLLAQFIDTNPQFATVPPDEQRRLERQLDIMVQYERVLQERISVFPRYIHKGELS